MEGADVEVAGRLRNAGRDLDHFAVTLEIWTRGSQPADAPAAVVACAVRQRGTPLSPPT